MNISVLGDGGWGTAQAILLAKKGHRVTLWSAFQNYAEELSRSRVNSKFLPKVAIPKEIRITADIGQAVSGCELLVVATPSRFLKPVVSRLKGMLDKKTIVLSVAKGLEQGSLKRMSEVIREEINPEQLAVLSGPSHAEEVSREIPTAVVVASENGETARRIQEAYTTDTFKVYLQSDVIGVELGGSLKNTIAIACGISDGLGFGANTKAALLSRGVVEISRLGVQLGARRDTFFGLSCTGDLVTTCVSLHSRNLRVGREMAKGRSIEEILSGMEMVAEGVETAKSAVELAAREKVKMPIAESLQDVISGRLKPLDAVSRLMSRQAGDEYTG